MSAGRGRSGELVTAGLGVVLALALLAAPDPPPRSTTGPRAQTRLHPRDARPDTYCAQTRGQVITAFRRDLQLTDDECMMGWVEVEPGGGQWGGTYAILNKGGREHWLHPDGRVTPATPPILDEEPPDERLWVRAVRFLLRGGWGG